MGGLQLNKQGRVIYSPVVKQANQKHARYIQNRYKKMPPTLSREGRGGVGDVGKSQRRGKTTSPVSVMWMMQEPKPLHHPCMYLLTQGEGLQRQR